jgi:hypothetical protein
MSKWYCIEQVPEATKERPAPVEYEEVAFEAFGKVGYILVSISTILINFGAYVAASSTPMLAYYPLQHFST